MKLAVIGAGSTYTPELVEGVLDRLQMLPVTELALYDIDLHRLRILTGFSRRMVRASNGEIAVTATDNLAKAVTAASFVLFQLRVGQQPARVLDESLPLQFGLLGQETTGPGGFGKALRTVPVVRWIARQVRQYAPDAWILNFTNPVGIITRALLDDGHRAVGLCNVAGTFKRRFANLLGVEPDTVELDHVGLNHLTWIRSVIVDGHERFPELTQPPHRAAIAADIDQPAELFETLGAIPSYYLKYFYGTRAMIEKQRESLRSHEVRRLENELLAIYANPDRDSKPALLAERGGSFYSEVASALMCSLHSGDGALHYVDVRNGNTIPELPSDTVIEVPARIYGNGPEVQPVEQLRPEMLSLIQSVAAYESLTLQAARTGDRTIAIRALLAHPLVREFPLAADYVDALLEADVYRVNGAYRI